MAREKFIEKGIYHHPHAAEMMSPKQYIIVERDGRRCLLLRFLNEAGVTVSDMQFKLTELDSMGRTIKISTVTAKKINVRAGETYAYGKGIVISDTCTDFRISVTSLISNRYKYSVRHGQRVERFDVRGYELGAINGRKSEAPVVKRRRIREGFMGKFTVVLVLLLIAATIGYFIATDGKNLGSFAEYSACIGDGQA